MIVSFRSVSAELWSLEPAPSPCHTELWPVQSAMQQWPHDTDTLCIYHSSLLALFQSTELQASDNSSRSNGDPLKLCPPSTSQRPLRAWHLAFEHVHFLFQVHNHEFFLLKLSAKLYPLLLLIRQHCLMGWLLFSEFVPFLSYLWGYVISCWLPVQFFFSSSALVRWC